MPTTVYSKNRFNAATDHSSHVLLQYAHESTGAIESVNGHDGMLHTCDYLDAIGMGKVAGHTPFHGYGRRESLATTTGGDDISDIAAVAKPYPNQSVGEQMTIVSTSASDTAAGTGARTIKLHYINAAGAYVHEIITLNGTTPVNTVATDIRFDQMISVQTNGTFGGNAAGTITLYKLATPATVYSQITAGNNVSMSSARMVPAGVDFWLKSITVSGTATKPLSVRVTATCDHAGEYIAGVFQFTEVIELEDSVVSIVLPVPRKIPALSIIKGVAVSNTAGGTVSVSYEGWTE